METESYNPETPDSRPAPTPGKVTVRALNCLLAALPKLNEDAESFAQDLDAIRKAALPARNPWSSQPDHCGPRAPS
ncbi:MAG: hypothetical protein H6969_12245 [Gammaproteobacteria bacterium]|nr:hypothetical protein [Candidatus Competibacteraceae bacterium]MCP5421240.1 hypothetical protein [Gammaproteobacteria bacterium]